MSSSLITLISLLRGINVGGHSKISMHALRGVYEGIGLRDPYTYLQSGNVVFRTKEQHLVRLAERIEIAIEQKFRFRPPVLLRSCSALRDVMARNPFAKHGIEVSKLLVMFLATEPDPETRNQLRKIDSGHEKLEIDGRELYLYLPQGVGRSKMWPLLERILKRTGTTRNWNTVQNLLVIAEKLQAS